MLKTAREFDGYVHQRFSYHESEVLSISTNAVDELWALLDYHSEINDSLNLLVDEYAKRDRPRIKSQFQAFIRQAKTYYYAAQPLHYRSSGLLYYYSFLNLAKAALILRKPRLIVGKKLMHGLSYEDKKRPFESERIKVQDGGVFPLFYKMQTGAAIQNGIEFRIKDLLAYCSFIGREYEICDYGRSKIKHCRVCVVADTKKGKGWTLLAIEKDNDVLRSQYLLNALKSYFEQIEVAYPYAEKCLKLSAREHAVFDFWQAKKPISIESDGTNKSKIEMKNVMDALYPYAMSDMFSIDIGFFVALPWQKTKSMAMTELLSAYAVMFYISSLVRYQPQILESILGSKHAWLLSSFVRQCGSSILTQFVSEILNRDFIFVNRQPCR